MNYITILAICVIAYIIGSFNFAIVISKWFMKDDIRNHGSRNAGTTNALRVLGTKIAVIVLAGDFFKASIAVLIGSYLFGEEGKLFAGLFVIIGHIFPIFFKFKGGKGVAAGAGMMFAFDVKIFLILAIVFFIIVFITKYVSLASMVASAFLPIGMYIFYENYIFTLTGLLVCVGIIYMHRTNIVRILNHEEHKVFTKKK